jgi:hypothetical protein
MAPRIAKAAQENIQLHRLRAQMKNAAAVETNHAVGRFQMAVNVDGLIEVKHAVRPPIQRMHQVVRVLGAEARQHHAPFSALVSPEKCSNSVLCPT